MTPAYAELVGWVCVFHLSSQRHPEVVPPEPTIQQRVQIQISQLPVPCPKPTITLTPGATPHDPVFLNLSQRSSLRLQILAASIPLQAVWHRPALLTSESGRSCYSCAAGTERAVFGFVVVEFTCAQSRQCTGSAD